jgi:hypothetical protein
MTVGTGYALTSAQKVSTRRRCIGAYVARVAEWHCDGACIMLHVLCCSACERMRCSCRISLCSSWVRTMASCVQCILMGVRQACNSPSRGQWFRVLDTEELWLQYADLETQELVETAPFDPLAILGGAPKRMEVLHRCRSFPPPTTCNSDVVARHGIDTSKKADHDCVIVQCTAYVVSAGAQDCECAVRGGRR